MNILISVFAKVAEYLVPPAKHCACLMFDSQATVRKLRKAVRHDGGKIEESVKTQPKPKVQYADIVAVTGAGIIGIAGKQQERELDQLLTCRQTFSTLTRPALTKGIEILQEEKLPELSSVDRTLKKIMEALEKSETNMVGVCGMTGIGKTTHFGQGSWL
ncbi:hypothetical protein Cgig2_008649 [Carnegiea gigantea]|uniref:Uncharacterized protein n=1 Tax=Carnegiea gigantea TaxID=171969 RepID=A0A9Q1JH22_9CARY|nr:hypothetical protein Cgig2_008649 [Carnegiea gigantea]